MGRPRGRPPTIDRASVEEMLALGWSQCRIAQVLGVTQPSISIALKRWGLR